MYICKLGVKEDQTVKDEFDKTFYKNFNKYLGE